MKREREAQNIRSKTSSGRARIGSQLSSKSDVRSLAARIDMLLSSSSSSSSVALVAVAAAVESMLSVRS